MKRTTICAALVLAAITSSAVAASHSGFAVVDSDGTLVRGSNGTSASNQGTGAYEVLFANTVRQCVFTASTGSAGSNGQNFPGFVTVAAREGNIRGVYVTTYDIAGNPADFAFHLNVRC